MIKEKITTHKIFLACLLIILFCSLPIIYNLMKPGFIVTQDADWMIIRFSAFYQAIADGQFPARFLHRLNFGYGYPVSNFLYPGFMYLATPIHLIGVDLVNTIKLIMIVSITGSGIVTFLWLSKIFRPISALTGAIYYMLAPYHIFDIYVRGSVGELLSLMFVPFIFWMIEKKNIPLISIGIFLLVLSHNSLSLLFAPLILIYMLISKKFLFKEIIFIIGSSILMSSFFILPAFFELNNTVFRNIKISDFNNYFPKIDLIGISTFLIILFGGSLIVYKANKEGIKNNYLPFLFLSISVISLALCLPLSSFIWRVLPSELIQFPFRLLSLTILGTSFICAYFLNQFKEKKVYLISFFIIGATFISSFNQLNSALLVNRDEAYFLTNEDTTTVMAEYMPVWVKNNPSRHFENKVEVLEGNAVVDNVMYDNKKISFDVFSNGDAVVRINTIYYPGWEASVDAYLVDIDYSNEKGVMDLKLNSGKKNVILEFKETKLRNIANLLSIFGFGLVLVYLIIKLKK